MTFERGGSVPPCSLHWHKQDHSIHSYGRCCSTIKRKSYTVGRIIERLVALHNGTVVVFDPYGEYGRAPQGGKPQFNPKLGEVGDNRTQLAIPVIQDTLQQLQTAGRPCRLPSGSSTVPVRWSADSLRLIRPHWHCQVSVHVDPWTIGVGMSWSTDPPARQ